MDSIVEAVIEEIDGKPCFVHHLQDPGESTLFLCPSARRSQSRNRYMDLNGKAWDVSIPLEIDCSPYFNDVIKEKDSYSNDYYERLDFDNHPVLPLIWCKYKKIDTFHDPYCAKCGNRTSDCFDYFFCVKCDSTSHKECVVSPFKIQSPLHPSHPLKLSSFYNPTTCTQCGRDARLVYHCTQCNLSMHTYCAWKPIPLSIDQPKRHHHPLTFFTRKASLDCNVCGLIKHMHSTYVCLKCNFVAHQDCADFPTVIRISRHYHIISFTTSLPFGKWTCGVCRKNVDNEYGAYTCKKCDGYVVHSRCALREDIWDGKELEGVLEEDDNEVVVDPFERISDGIILHFCHDHYLKLEKSREDYDETKICHACVIPIYEGDFYSCMECNFILHDNCANAPRRIRHPLHPNPLTLNVTSEYYPSSLFHCDVCHRFSSGFIYEARVNTFVFKLDMRCASISEPIDYQGHEHPLFLSLDPREKYTCQGCQGVKETLINCIECDFIRCLECVTLPYKAKYKHDNHFLELDHWEEANEPDWCEVCETLIDNEKGADRRFYRCKECCTTLHRRCLFGEDPYMKPGHNFTSRKGEVQILPNNSLSRPICHHCHNRCKDKILYRREGNTYCSFDHVDFFIAF